MDKKLPTQARVVIVGGGIAGCSTAYHLAKLGWQDVVLLERGKLTGGTTWHAAGLVTQLRSGRTLIELSKYGVDLYSRLEVETGYMTGFKQTGSITVARTQNRMDELLRIASLCRSRGIDVEPITVSEAGKLWPLMRTDDLVGAIHIPKDGQTLPKETAMAVAMAAKKNGVSIFEDVKVTEIHREGGSVRGISTDRGDITCEVLVNCGGMWAREIGLMCGVNIPLHAAEHMYLVTNPMGIPEDISSLRDPDEQIYFRRDKEEEGAILMGGFESIAKPWGMDGIPENYSFSLLDPDWEHFKIFWESAIYRVPLMDQAGINRFYVSAESFTPDNQYIIGEAPELRNFFVAAGLNSSGIAAGAGVGKAVSEWIVEGYPTMDLNEVDIRRFQHFQNNPYYLYDRTIENVGTVYGMHWPQRQPDTARNARKSPFHDRLATLGACFGEVAGWERPNWYAPKGVEAKYEYSYGRQNWFPYSADEHRAVRERVGLFDQSSFAKFVLQGLDSEAVLQRMCANDVGVPTGRVVYTSLLNDRGGIEADLTVTRIEEGRFLIVTSGATSTRDFGWINANIPSDAHAFLTDVTSADAVLGVMGPQSRELLSRLTKTDLSNDAFPYLTSRQLWIGYAPVRATRVTFVGELGWELYIPTEFSVGVYDLICEAGNAFDMRHVGFHAMESLRIEKAYRGWGHDITDQDTPLEAGLRFAVAFDKAFEFRGKMALQKQLDQGIRKRLVVFTVDDPEPMLYGDEPIYRNGILVGNTTCGSYGHTIGRSVGMGYVNSDEIVNLEFILSGSYEIEIAGSRFSATASLRPVYDPKGECVRV